MGSAGEETGGSDANERNDRPPNELAPPPPNLTPGQRADFVARQLYSSGGEGQMHVTGAQDLDAEDGSDEYSDARNEMATPSPIFHTPESTARHRNKPCRDADGEVQMPTGACDDEPHGIRSAMKPAPSRSW